MDWVEAIAEKLDDPEARPAGFAEPHYTVSENVRVSRDNGLYVYHIDDDQLGQGSSFGNAHAWAETKGTGDMLNLFSIDIGEQVLSGTSIVYMLPFSDLSSYGNPSSDSAERLQHTDDHQHHSYARTIPSSHGVI